MLIADNTDHRHNTALTADNTDQNTMLIADKHSPQYHINCW